MIEPLDRWQALLALDAETLTELAGAGLLRRGAKDLAEGRVAPAAEAGQFEVDGQQVKLDPRGWAHARCSCPAPDWCKHRVAAILALPRQLSSTPALETTSDAESAVLAEFPLATNSATPHLRAQAVPEPATTAPAEAALLAEIAALDPQQCLRLAGSAARQRLPRLLSQIEAVRWTARPGSLRIELEGLEQGLSYLRHGGWAGMHSEGTPASQSALKLAALWALWRQTGRELPDPSEVAGRSASTLEQGEGAATCTLLRAVQAELQHWLQGGLGQLAPVRLERMALLAIDARADALPALAGRLRQLVETGRRLRARDDQIDEGALLQGMASCQAWCSTMLRAPADRRELLGGGPRRFIEQEVELSLLVAGAHWWTRPGGARGLSVLFWDPQAQRLRRCTQARGDGSDRAFTQAAVWSAPLWTGLASPERLLDAAAVRLRRVRLSATGDLAPGPATGELQAASPAVAPGVADWRQLAQQLNDELDLFEVQTPYLLLAPSRILPLQLDELQQAFCWPLLDHHDRLLALRWPCGDQHQRHSRLLTHWSELPGRKCLLVACSTSPVAALQPVSLLHADGGRWRAHALQYSAEPRGLSLSSLPGRITRLLAERRAPPVVPRSRLQTELLDPLCQGLVLLASRGRLRLPPDQTALRRCGDALELVGLSHAAAAWRRWREATADAGQRLLDLHWQVTESARLLDIQTLWEH